MKKALFLFVLLSLNAFSQSANQAFKNGEFLKYRVSYGLLSAGLATVELEAVTLNGRDVYHVKGLGWTTGVVNVFFPVLDDYQSYFDKKTMAPYRFIRNIREGGYTKNIEIFFDHDKKEARVVDHKNNDRENTYSFAKHVNDMLSSLYYLRSIDFGKLKKGDIIKINMFYDNRENKVHLKYLGKEIIKTKFGKLRTLALRPIVEEGRIFKDKEGVKMWLTDDHMKIPVKAKAAILVGSLKMDLIEYKGINGILPVNYKE